MQAKIKTVAFQGLDVREVDVQVMMASGLPAFTIVGLADKSVAESKERVRAALTSLGVGLPPKRITINLAPADLPKEGAHYDLPIALGVLAAMGILPADELDDYYVMGELSLDGSCNPVSGVLPAAVAAVAEDRNIICPEASGPEAAWAGELEVLAPPSLLALINHFKGTQVLTPPAHGDILDEVLSLKLEDIKGQETAKRALEVAAAGGHNLLMTGPPGSGKSMLASRLPGLLPPLDAAEALEVNMISSIAGEMKEGRLSRRRPFSDPHHSASVAAMVGGGRGAKPGEVSLAHLGVLFLDELPEFNRQVLESLRQPVESGKAVVARANLHVTYPARMQLVAAMNPCRCGHLDDASLACARAPKCAMEYRSRISGPMLDRIDIHVDVPAVSAANLTLPPPTDTTEMVAARVFRAREIQRERYKDIDHATPIRTNADAEGEILEQFVDFDTPARHLLQDAIGKLKLSARGYHRVLRVARTLADLEASEAVSRSHIAEALEYRRRLAMGG
ncbi:YifB family Mg chelatase-like AAA ATPase [Sneathiella chungangensis]|uniref:YifB family Mg chelatase-like AAA ATPase n=1 Tax=Sneathiella chungangensis TaxID=1418234 RepID=A0A845MMX5_9PROT|nr:YifB family Mg chelatase-like AAA ATPase [Sneathiella chungangensis]MZR24217.1 YifB family Mg chelatase-like AAA ATPase [Sneathiella chungangensis]